MCITEFLFTSFADEAWEKTEDLRRSKVDWIQNRIKLLFYGTEAKNLTIWVTVKFSNND